MLAGLCHVGRESCVKLWPCDHDSNSPWRGSSRSGQFGRRCRRCSRRLGNVVSRQTARLDGGSLQYVRDFGLFPRTAIHQLKRRVTGQHPGNFPTTQHRLGQLLQCPCFCIDIQSLEHRSEEGSSSGPTATRYEARRREARDKRQPESCGRRSGRMGGRG